MEAKTTCFSKFSIASYNQMNAKPHPHPLPTVSYIPRQLSWLGPNLTSHSTPDEQANHQLSMKEKAGVMKPPMTPNTICFCLFDFVLFQGDINFSVVFLSPVFSLWPLYI